MAGNDVATVALQCDSENKKFSRTLFEGGVTHLLWVNFVSGFNYNK